MSNNLRGLGWLAVIVAVDLLFMSALLLLWVVDGFCIFVGDRYAGCQGWIDRRFNELYKDW